MAQPKYLNQGVNYLGFLSKQLGDLRGITTLAHELIQNADDAKDDAGVFSATRITFDIRDDALIVSNDAAFREIDFDRMRDVAGGSKRSEEGGRTTGAFGVGFVSVYQVTDRPEIHSSGRRWTMRPDEPEDQRIEQHSDSSITKDKGAVFKLPWAFEESVVRRELKVSPVNRDRIDSFVNELKDSLPKAILFLKNLNTIELRRSGKSVRCVTRVVDGNQIIVYHDGVRLTWRIVEGEFMENAWNLKSQFPSDVEKNREDRVRIAIPNALLNDGLLYATLPTEQSTGLPFHIDADFFPASDRKEIMFEDTRDHRSEWNRAAIHAAATVFRDNLDPLRGIFRQDALTFWAVLNCLQNVYQEHRDNIRKPLGAFWKTLLPSLQTSPIVYTESGKWLEPTQVRIPTGSEEEEAVSVFGTLGIEIVHQDLWKYRNILTRKDLGVEKVAIRDVYEALDMRELTEHPQPVPCDFQNHDSLELLCKGIHGILKNTPGQPARQEAERMLKQCSLAPGLDARLWPCGSVYLADNRTREIFANLMPPDRSFLAKNQIPLMDTLCPQFGISSAIKELERLDTERFKIAWKGGSFDPVALLRWFDDNKKELSEDNKLRERLARIPVFPSAEDLHPLDALRLPGGFDDPLKETDLVDMIRLGGFRDFLRFLSAKELTFTDYVENYVSQAFAPNSVVSMKVKHKLLDILSTRIGEIGQDEWLKTKLAETNIVECTDGEFRQPNEVYFSCKEVQEVLRNSVHYARLPKKSEGRTEFYRWLGVESRPRPYDVSQFIDELTAVTPNQNSTHVTKRILEIIGKTFPNLPDNVKNCYRVLQSKAWLLSESDSSKWYKPGQLYAAYNKNLFESQAQFIDLPVGIQRRINDFLRYLGVNLSPQPFHVVRHLLECSKGDDVPPKGIYQWLNDNTQPGDLKELRDPACFRVGDKYLRPDQVFWGQHHFGRFRIQLGPDLLLYQDLLRALNVREMPDYSDAFEVLKEISEDIGNNPLRADDRNVVFQCWVMLAESLEHDKINSEDLKTELKDIKCVLNPDDILYPPSWVFFEDRPGLLDKFSNLLSKNSIKRTERVWPAMEAAGVRPISAVVKGLIDEDDVNPREDEKLKKRVIERTDLIKTILEGVAAHRMADDAEIQLDNIRFLGVEELRVTWKLHAFDRTESTQPEPSSAHLERSKEAIYFVLQRGSYPWSAIARELTQALAPGDEISSISPGLKIILEADSRRNAVAQLDELGIAHIRELNSPASPGIIAGSFDEAPPSPQQQEVPTSSQDGIDQDTPPPVSEPTPAGTGEPAEEDPFAKKILEVQTPTPPDAPHTPVVIPEGGAQTEESAITDTQKSGQFGRAGGHVRKKVTQWEPKEVSRELADKFKKMVHGDYGKRCQICSKSFKMDNDKSQVFVIHVVQPSADHRTNHFGNLLGLCGWHYALVRYGAWAFWDPETDKPFKDDEGEGWKRMRDFVRDASKEIDSEGNTYVGLRVRFSNVYQGWNSLPDTVTEEIRYSIPHWKYLCKLLAT